MVVALASQRLGLWPNQMYWLAGMKLSCGHSVCESHIGYQIMSNLPSFDDSDQINSFCQPYEKDFIQQDIRCQTPSVVQF